MKVAIIGAGISGLSCAFELEKYGVVPDIFEKNHYVGNFFNHNIVSMKIFSCPARYPIKYFRKKYKLNLEPLFPLNKIIMKSSSKSTTIDGSVFGHVFKSGSQSYSIENQIKSNVKAPIFFDTLVNFKDIQHEYDVIVAATGDGCIAKELGIWNIGTQIQVRSATVVSKFETGFVKMWLNTDYSKNCYCYLVPNSEKEASLIMALNNSSLSELDYYWKEFLLKEEVNYPITETRDSEYSTGYPDFLQIGNIYFTGNSAGTIDDLLGFGAFRAIESGILLARAIIKDLDYSKLLKPLLEDVKHLHEFRKLLDTFDNNDYDRLVTFLGLPGIKQFIYKNPFFSVKHYAFAVKLLNRIKSS